MSRWFRGPSGDIAGDAGLPDGGAAQKPRRPRARRGPPVIAVIDGGRAGGERPLTEPVTRTVLAPVIPIDAARVQTRGDSIVEIYQAEHVALFRFVRAATGDDQLAEDVLQETFLRLIREVAAGRLPANVHAWLFRVATNVVVSQIRRSRTAERHQAEMATERLVASPEDHVLEAERDDAVRVALETLPVDGRIAILLAAQGFTGHEIAVILGRTDGAVRTLLCRSRLRVRQLLSTQLGERAEVATLS